MASADLIRRAEVAIVEAARLWMIQGALDAPESYTEKQHEEWEATKDALRQQCTLLTYALRPPEKATPGVVDEVLATATPLVEQILQAYRVARPDVPFPWPPRLPGPRASTRKIELPWTDVSFTPAPNVQNHGTRNLASSISGGASWGADPSGGYAVIATIGNRMVARVDLTPGQEASAMLGLMSRIGSPSAIKTMVAASRLVWEKTGRMPFQRAATIGIGELARAAGYDPGDGRNIDPEIRQRIVQELRALTLIETLATESPYDKKTKRRKGEWVAPLLVVTAAYKEILHAEDGSVPTEIDIMLGRNWATAYAETDLVQIPAGFMKLHDDSVIRLAWYYVMTFRYRMMKPSMVIERPIRLLCSEAEIEIGESKNRGRFLGQLDRWHGDLVKQGIIGSYQRDPEIGTDERPSTVFEQGIYTVRPTQDIIDVYQRRAVEPPLPARVRRPRRAPAQLALPG